MPGTLRHGKVAGVQRRQIARIQSDGFRVTKHTVGRTFGANDVAFFANQASPFREIHRVDAQPLVVRVG